MPSLVQKNTRRCIRRVVVRGFVMNITFAFLSTACREIEESRKKKESHDTHICHVPRTHAQYHPERCHPWHGTIRTRRSQCLYSCTCSRPTRAPPHLRSLPQSSGSRHQVACVGSVACHRVRAWPPVVSALYNMMCIRINQNTQSPAHGKEQNQRCTL